MDFPLAQFVDPLSFLFDVAGIVLVALGGILAVYEWVRVQVVDIKDREKRKNQIQDLRIHFSQKIVLGLEFFLAADIIRLIATPSDTETLIRVGVVITIRTIVAYFLSKEIRESRV